MQRVRNILTACLHSPRLRASSRLSWCRPVLSDHARKDSQEDGFVAGGGAIAIRNGRYAIDVSSTGASASLGGGDFVPNDTYSSALQNFTVITGINGSGKSTYLKQIALIVILAHCGSYVPADEAILPIRDQICTRIGTSDDQEHNISTFLLEMKETAFICNSTTDRSLFLLDELGRATSNEDGVAVAWAVSEFLLTKRAMVRGLEVLRKNVFSLKHLTVIPALVDSFERPSS